MKAVDIEHLVRWAYCEELPKQRELVADAGRAPAGFAAPWATVTRAGEELALMRERDAMNCYGLFPDMVERGEAHPDAVLIAQAVVNLRDGVPVAQAGWNPLSDLGDLGADGTAACARAWAMLMTVDEEGSARMRRSPAALVVRHAILGGVPPWEAEAPRRVPVTQYGRPKWFRLITEVSAGAFGPVTHQMEVDGFDHARRRPYPGAYQRTLLVPDPSIAALARLEYEIWHGALCLLAERLAGALSAHRVLPPARACRPWKQADVPVRVLPSLQVIPQIARPAKRKNARAA